MGTLTNFLLFSFVVGTAQSKVIFKPDNPYVRVEVHHRAVLKCCFTSTGQGEHTWIKRTAKTVENVTASDRVAIGKESGISTCGSITFERVQLKDSGLYQCVLGKAVFSHGTYLQVFKYLEKTINIEESTKNKILMAEGILLLLCVLVPSCTLLLKSKRLNQLEKKKVKKEEENIYQGLNLDECWSTYDQIERSQAHGPYQDVGNVKEEEEQIQLEKP
ncbi:B-cell antigen receptor complex-associated protein alpha chain [Epinephelus fuscoguttatus]|uniref:B-cell antigen receptor complex-associated protein alpha chain n=1 Tax=Epinephelus fuscoguttatus TaxID=293821 RepID=UPI0020D004F5|nr:B-cell antigen receptor complex-associated protein alpha chain [Epinephelus fuscoguttatus]